MRSVARVALPNGWARNTVNTCIYRGAGLLTAFDHQFGAYYESGQSIVVFRRNLIDGQVTLSCLDVVAAIKDAHNCISIGCDGEGYLHLSYGQHGSRLSYVQSRRPLDIGSFSEPESMSGLWEDSVTYPYFVSPRSPEQPLLFLYRRGSATAGDVHLKVLDTTTRRWRDIPAPILAGSQLQPWSSGPYLNHPAVDSAGRLHLFFTWRAMLSGREQLVNNHNIDYARSADWGSSWEASNRHVLPLPITPVSTETVFGTPPAANLMNQCGAAVDGAGNPFVTFYVGGTEGINLHLMWHDGRAWSQRVIEGVHDGFELKGRGTLRLPISRPDLVVDRRRRVWLIYRPTSTRQRMVAVRLEPPSYDVALARTFLLWSGDLGSSEPVLDRGRLGRDGILSLFLQRTEQGDNEALAGPPTSPVFVADWDLDDAAGVGPKVQAR